MRYKISIIFFLIPIFSFCQIISGKVVRVADGDTITILDSDNTQTRVRFYGIDCPEIGQDFDQVTPKTCFGLNRRKNRER